MPATLEQALVERLAEQVAVRVAEILADRRDPSPEPAPDPDWRERLWTAHPETRIGKHELLEALGRSESWLYSRTSSQCPPAKRIPHRVGDSNELVFVVGEIRAWIARNETRVLSLPVSSDTPGERKRRSA